MFKKTVIIVSAIILILAAGFGVAYFMVKPDKKRIVDFIRENPERIAISLSQNEKVLAEYNETKMLPLASTVKIIIAIEYAYQVAEGKLNPDQKCSVSDLEKYHYPATDGGAHKAWLNNLELEKDSIVSLSEISKGMIKYSSNANTEYLIDLLGLENINSRIELLGIEKHDSIYYLVSSLFIRDYLFPEKSNIEAIKSIKDLSNREYRNACREIHKKLKAGTFKNDSLNDFGLVVQKVWSDRLPASTAKEYRQLMEKLNSKSILPKEVHQHLDPILEFVMENPLNQEWLKHSGSKGGSTASLLTKALYATDMEGNKIHLSYFLNNLSAFENVQLQMSMNAFELAILQEEEFRIQIREVVNALD
ncbi:D-alanyl-D-alanine carboxypeptidase [Marivirga sericea]|uniref:beta-lactamase n=1 Tax=Marivirga sericea TaxID=1028 RepID=A0A1X7K4H1_9BACT|nr:serine hydrolase [Marivirga sericea]SMG35506.1 D-alanyl-D-alanine carboxypeptidase [Marivirga sericea]